MTPRLLLEQINLLLESPPPTDSRIAYQREHFQWLGKANALVAEWNPREAIGFKMASDWAAGNLNRSSNVGQILTTLHTAAASLEQSLPEPEGQVFGPGAVYDFFRALNDVVSSAEHSLLAVDPYMDAQVFDAYLSNCRPGVAVRLLASRYAVSVAAASVAFRQQHNANLEVRSTREIHDRLIIVDQLHCWVLGASIKDAADRKPTYLAPLPTELVAAKVALYEGVWANAQGI
ncbi:hypothetical protein [Cognatiluteimonas weifangensis]|uniref:hypothetical protein n=1 Tax=Cognatiluteimonas weifangensis TaxID=2303539 RepID=UPI0011C155C4|nr:hypothetical protein [Luteimonas weifangensis]